jgi:hypothetical protein
MGEETSNPLPPPARPNPKQPLSNADFRKVRVENEPATPRG